MRCSQAPATLGARERFARMRTRFGLFGPVSGVRAYWWRPMAEWCLVSRMVTYTTRDIAITAVR